MGFFMNQNHKSIVLQDHDAPQYEGVLTNVDGAAGSAFNPGMLIELTAADPTDLRLQTVQAHQTAGANTRRAFVIEDELQGKGIYQSSVPATTYGAPPNTDLETFAASDRLQYRVFQPGDRILGVLQVDGGGSDVVVAKGALLYSAGDGTLTPTDGGSYAPVAIALASVTLTADASDDRRCYTPIEITT